MIRLGRALPPPASPRQVIERRGAVGHTRPMRRALTLALTVVLAACVPQREAPPPPPVVTSAPTPVPALPLPQGPWEDRPLTPGTWRYAPVAGGSEARFGAPGVERFSIRCDRSAGRIVLTRPAATGRAMTVRTTSTTRAVAAQPLAGAVTAALAPNDPLLDAIGFSRGRFAVETPGAPGLVLPAWAEVLRVTEDCR